MRLIKRSLCHLTCCAIMLALSACDAKDNIPQATQPTQPNAAANKPTTPVSTEQVRGALSSPNEDVKQTPLGTLTIRHSEDSTNTPGKIFLNGELIYTARSEEVIPHLRGRPFNLNVVDGEGNGKDRPNYRITRMVVREESYTCQYIVLDFTGPRAWISNRFPKEAFQGGQCVDLTWVRWDKDLAFFYFGAEESDWDEDGYRGWVEGYNPKFKAVFGPVDAPPPPKYCSLIPKPTNPYFREAGEPTCEDGK